MLLLVICNCDVDELKIVCSKIMPIFVKGRNNRFEFDLIILKFRVYCHKPLL